MALVNKCGSLTSPWWVMCAVLPKMIESLEIATLCELLYSNDTRVFGPLAFFFKTGSLYHCFAQISFRYNYPTTHTAIHNTMHTHTHTHSHFKSPIYTPLSLTTL